MSLRRWLNKGDRRAPVVKQTVKFDNQILQQHLGDMDKREYRVVYDGRDGRGTCYYIPSFWTHEKADRLFYLLRTNASELFTPEEVVLFGNEITLTERQTFYLQKKDGPPYTYSGKTRVGFMFGEDNGFVNNEGIQEMFTLLEELRRQACQLCGGCDFNTAIVNQYLTKDEHIAYRKAKDLPMKKDMHEGRIGWHGDSEEGLEEDGFVFGFALGYARAFQLRPKRNEEDHKTAPWETLKPVHGSALVMDLKLQRHREHRIGPEVNAPQQRISITMRGVKPNKT